MKCSHPRGVRRTAFAGLIALMLAPATLTPVHAQVLPPTPDPSTPGPYAVTKEEYAFGTAADPSGQTTLASSYFTGYTTTQTVAGKSTPVDGLGGPNELIGSVWYPSTAAGSGVPAPGKKFPLILFLHGRHGTDYAPQTFTIPATMTTVARTVVAGTSGQAWPPPTNYVPIPSYEGYDYASSVLASDGYVVISIGVDGINAYDGNSHTLSGISGNGISDAGALARAEVVQKQLDVWKDLSTTGDLTHETPSITTNTFGTKFVGVVDMTNIGLMGHSRGGEGVMAEGAYNINPRMVTLLNGNTVPLNPEVKTTAGGAVIPAYPIHAILPLAPIDFNRYVVNNIPTAVIIPYCDGDVSDNQGMHFFDDERYNLPSDPAPKYFWTIMGADHDLGNTVWTPSLFPFPGAPATVVTATGTNTAFGGVSEDWVNDGTGAAADPFAGNVPGHTATNTTAAVADALVITNLLPTRLTPLQQQAIERNYFIAFFRTYIGGETQFLPFLRGDTAPPASNPANQTIYETYQAPASLRLDVNDFVSSSNLSSDAQGSPVSEVGLSPFAVVGGSAPGSDSIPALRPLPGQPSARQPNNTPSNYSKLQGLSQLSLGWSKPGAYLENDLPSSDVSSYTAFQFRAAINFTDSRNRVYQSDFSVVLTDAFGKTSSVPISKYSSVLTYPPGKVLRLPKVSLNAVRIPMTAFTGVDLTRIASVKFVFDRQPMGALLVSDVTFNSPDTATAFSQ